MQRDITPIPRHAQTVELSSPERRVALVLGGGGLKGFAHIGVVRALQERGIRPTTYAGTSIGALIAAAYTCGMSLDEMQRRAESLQRRDLFRLNRMEMLLDRFQARSIYLEEPLRGLCESAIPTRRFDEVDTQLLVNTVDIERGTQLIWGLPGLQHVPIVDAVYASCALPGYFPAGRVDGRICVDGGTSDNLPVNVAATDADAVIAVDVGNTDLSPSTNVAARGFAALFMRAATVMMHSLQLYPLEHWTGPPMLLIRPRVSHLGWFSFGRTAELIQAGYDAAIAALDDWDRCIGSPSGIYPLRSIALSVDREKCIGCTTCVGMAPHLMGMDAEGKAFARTERVEWSPANGDFVHHCPTRAIIARPLDDPTAVSRLTESEATDSGVSEPAA